MKTGELFLGRMQPIHNGHLKVISGMKNPVVALVKGSISSKNKNKNPLDSSYQSKLLKKVAPGVKVIEVPNGYIPDIIAAIRSDHGIDITKIHAGSDRIREYKAQIERANKSLPDDQKIKVGFTEVGRDDEDVSATQVREAIRSGDEKAFKAKVPKSIWGEFNHLQQLLKEEIMDIGNIKSFEEWLQEEEKKDNPFAKKDEKED